MIAKDPRGRWMSSKDRPGLYGHETGGVEIAARTEGVFCFPDGRIVLTDKAVKDVAALSEAAKAMAVFSEAAKAASQDDRESPSRNWRSRRVGPDGRVAAKTGWQT
jgi:hypothetical protein